MGEGVDVSHYKTLLDSAYSLFTHTGVIYPAASKNGQKVLQDNQAEKVAALISGGTSNLQTTLQQCDGITAKASSGGYATKAALETDTQNCARQLKSQVQGLADLFKSFEREQTAWIKQGATLSWSARQDAVNAQRQVDSTFLIAVSEIEANVNSDFTVLVRDWKEPETKLKSDTGKDKPDHKPDPDTGKDKPDHKPEPKLEPDPTILNMQREALMDAALDGAPFVEIDPALMEAA